MKRIFLILTIFAMPFAAFAQSVTLLNSPEMAENSSADVQYNNEFGTFIQPDLDEPFPYVVFRVDLVGDVAEAKSKLNLYLGYSYKVEAVDKNKQNMMIFLIPDGVRTIYLNCGDGCEGIELYHGSLITNKVYGCRVEYHKKQVEQQVVQQVIQQGVDTSFVAAMLAKQRAELNALLESKESDEPRPLADSIVLSWGGVKFKMMLVKGGKFYMGSDGEKVGKVEKPAHYVTMSDYYMAETEVTQALWKAVNETDPSYFKGDSLPVENVTWNECVKFISTLNTCVVGYHFNLPTEAQWEYAARGGSDEKSKYFRYSGGNDLVHLGWYEGNSGKKTHNVKSLRGNALGIYDMNGNVAEWCSDFFDKYQQYDLTDPAGPTKGDKHVVRGGNCDSESYDCRNTSRYSSDPSRQSPVIGFRIVMPVPSEDLMYPEPPAEPVESVEPTEQTEPTESVEQK